MLKSHTPTSRRSKEDFLILANQSLQIFKSLSPDQVDPQNEKPGYGNMGEQRTGECKGPGRKEETNMEVRVSPSRDLLTTHEMGWAASKPRA